MYTVYIYIYMYSVFAKHFKTKTHMYYRYTTFSFIPFKPLLGTCLPFTFSTVVYVGTRPFPPTVSFIYVYRDPLLQELPPPDGPVTVWGELLRPLMGQTWFKMLMTIFLRWSFNSCFMQKLPCMYNLYFFRLRWNWSKSLLQLNSTLISHCCYFHTTEVTTDGNLLEGALHQRHFPSK